jgi:beta-hydroxylase
MRERHVFSAAAQLCPRTVSILTALPAAFNAAFAALEAGGAIAAHQGSSNRVDRCHLGLVVPDGDVRLQVSGVPRRWSEGRLMIFNDRAWHEAWNRSAQRRFVLIVDLEKAAAARRTPLLMEQP